MSHQQISVPACATFLWLSHQQISVPACATFLWLSDQHSVWADAPTGVCPACQASIAPPLPDVAAETRQTDRPISPRNKIPWRALGSLTTRNTVVFYKLKVAQLVKNSYVNRRSITSSQKPAKSPYPEPHNSNLKSDTLYLPSIPRSFKLSLPFSFSNQEFLHL